MARGYKTGGRKKGTPNKITRQMREGILEGETPLDYMIRVMRTPTLRGGIGQHSPQHRTFTLVWLR